MIALLLPMLAFALQPDRLEADIDCVSARITPDQREAMSDEVEGTGGRPIREAFRVAAARCASERTWATSYAASVERLSAARLLAASTGARLTRAGIDLAVVDSWWAAQPPDFDAANPNARASLSVLEERLVASGVARRTLDRQVTTLGYYIAALGVTRAELLTIGQAER